MRVSTNEVMDYWRALSDADRKPWEDQAAKACAAYLEEVMQRAKELEGDEGDDDEVGGGVGKCQICTRVLKLTRHHMIPKSEHGRFGQLGAKYLLGEENVLM